MDTASGFCTFGGLRLVVVVGLLGSQILFCKFLLFLYYSWVAPPVPLLVGLGGPPVPCWAVPIRFFFSVFSVFGLVGHFWSPVSFFPPPVRA